jgi:RNA ligase (TIGR02306 family)
MRIIAYNRYDIVTRLGDLVKSAFEPIYTRRLQKAMERKLASIQQVLEIHPIENADAIERVQINGWQCVTKKQEFAVGDLGVFFEIDAIPADEELFRFLWKSKSTPEGEIAPRPNKFRIRTMKLRGTLSQGLFMPLSAFPQLPPELSEGDDVTELLGVGKYEPPAPAGMGNYRGTFPQVLPRTDEMRIQSHPKLLTELYGKPYAMTQKYDGTSATYLIHPQDESFHACSRNFTIEDGDNLYWEMAHKHKIEAILREYPQYAIQGEIVGPGIQKNPLALATRDLFVFNVYNLVDHKPLGHVEARAWLASVGLNAVATTEQGEAFDETIESLLVKAEGKYPGTGNEREGIVIRPLIPEHSPILQGWLSFKAISNAYLLCERD